MRFEKWQALGNDYLILESAELPFVLTPARIRRICDRNLGIGADGILLLSAPPEPSFAAALRIFNPDGSEAELSGNGARQAALYLRRSGHVEVDEFAIQTVSGPIHPRITGPHSATIEIGRAATHSGDYPAGSPDGRGQLTAAGREWSFQHVSIGNPQCAILCEELEQLDLALLGPPIEHHALFPNRTNVSWYRPLREGAIRARIFERGVGETLASGTGASGAAVAHHLASGERQITVSLDGGELEVAIGEELAVTLGGWAVPVFSGNFAVDLLEELHATQ